MKLLLLSLLLLTGCSTFVPVKQNFPMAPSSLLETCATLAPIDPKAELSTVAKTINENYQQYWICAIKTDAWIDWYKRQKFIYEGVN
jgi:hypothetical protein